MDQRHAKFTTYGWSVCLWVLIIAFQYGYHISVLNQIEAVLTCRTIVSSAPEHQYTLPTCIPMSNFVFSVVTAVFTIGGLLGSLVSNIVMDRSGRKGAARTSALLVMIGSGLMSISNSVTFLGLGRLLVGLGAGVGLCVGPIYLAEIAPSRISGNVGVLTQLAIVLGIMVTQALGLRFATPTEWRLVPLISCVLSAVQFIISGAVVESPTWLGAKNRMDEKAAVAHKLWVASLPDIQDPLLDELEAHSEEVHQAAITVPQLLSARELRKPLMIVCLAMVSQQLSGINAVLYYSNNILSKALPEFAPYVSLGITVVNVLMTFPPIILIERMGRRQLLTISTSGAVMSLFLIGTGLNSGYVTLPSIAILTFVMSYALGLGPIPFVMIPEVSPRHAVSALSSMALSLNWTANFIVGLLFLPLRDLLAGGDEMKGGRVFYVFVALLLCSVAGLSRYYRG